MFVILDILEESYLYKQIKEIVPLIGLITCIEKNKKCTPSEQREPIDTYISFAYPSMKFTFSFPDIFPGGSFYTLLFHLKKNIPCLLLLEDTKRFTRRPVKWKKEIIFDDSAFVEFSRNNESTVYEFALSLR